MTVLWKKENDAAVSLLIIFCATALCNYLCTHIHTVLKCSVKSKLGSYVYIATVKLWI